MDIDTAKIQGMYIMQQRKIRSAEAVVDKLLNGRNKAEWSAGVHHLVFLLLTCKHVIWWLGKFIYSSPHTKHMTVNRKTFKPKNILTTNAELRNKWVTPNDELSSYLLPALTKTATLETPPLVSVDITFTPLGNWVVWERKRDSMTCWCTPDLNNCRTNSKTLCSNVGLKIKYIHPLFGKYKGVCENHKNKWPLSYSLT